MQPYAEMSTEELQELRKQLSAQYKEFQGKDLKLDMSRGKPSVEQLDLSMGMMDVLSSSDDLTCEDGTDCRNYGGLTGIREPKSCRRHDGGSSGLHHHLRQFQPECYVRYRIPIHDSRRNGMYSVVQIR